MDVSKTSSNSLKQKDKTKSTDLSKSAEMFALTTNLACHIKKLMSHNQFSYNLYPKTEWKYTDCISSMFFLEENKHFPQQCIKEQRAQHFLQSLYLSLTYKYKTSYPHHFFPFFELELERLKPKNKPSISLCS